jgi:2-polyprenyl-6-hydroxyphenyl methylase / 3-demethylubiquinone-9 3-methyltransferase
MNPHPNGAETVDRDEVARFSRLAGEWWDPRGPMAALHKFNPVRLAYIRDRAAAHFGREPASLGSLAGLRFLDIGCGGGILSEPLARLGAVVVGIDPSDENIAVAQAHAAAVGLTIDYRAATAEALAAAGESFEVVLAMEVAEYVLRWVPRGTHRWDKFVTPDELETAIGQGGLRIAGETGVIYNLLADRWQLSRDTDVNYMMVAEKPRA